MLSSLIITILIIGIIVIIRIIILWQGDIWTYGRVRHQYFNYSPAHCTTVLWKKCNALHLIQMQKNFTVVYTVHANWSSTVLCTMQCTLQWCGALHRCAALLLQIFPISLPPTQCYLPEIIKIIVIVIVVIIIVILSSLWYCHHSCHNCLH